MVGRRRWAALVGVVLIGSSAAALVGSPVASAVPDRYGVVASGSAGSATYYMPDFLIVSTVGGGGPTAQVSLDSTRGSQGFASSPYPGEAVVGLPPTLRGASGAPVPDYPLYVSSRSPSVPKDERSAPGYLIRSASSDASSAAVAESGLADPNVKGASSIVRANSAITEAASTADSVVDIQSFGLKDVLDVGRVKATAKVVVNDAGKVRLSSSFEALRTTLAGQAVSITAEGIVAAGQTVPLPDASPAVQALEKAGVTIEYLAPTKTSTSVVSAGLRISMKGAAPPEVPAIGGVPITATYILGQAAASVRAESDEALPPIGLPPGGTTTAGGTSAPRGDAGTPQLQAKGGQDGSPSGLAAPRSADPPRPAVAGEGEGTTRTLPLALLEGSIGGTGSYLVLILAALAALTGATLWRLLGVRNLWA